MALALKDRVKETTIVVGTGTATLLGSSIGFQPFSVVGNGNTTYYCISDQFGSNWEVGIGTYTTSGNTLARTTVLSSSNADALVVFTAGIKDVFVTYPSSKGLWKDASGNAIGLGTPASGVVTNLTGTASININGTVGATTATTGAFTTLAYTGTLTGGTGVVAIGTNQIYKDASGNVGIGTSSPSQRLTISDTGSGLNRDLAVRNGDATNYHQLAIGYNAGALNSGVPANSLFMLAEKGGGYGTVGGLSLGTIGAAPTVFIINGAEAMRINSSGNVGIGTTNPISKLHVEGTTTNSSILVSNITSGLNIGTISNYASWQGSGTSDDFVVSGYGARSLVLGTNGAPRMVIDSSGNVGIGGTSNLASSKLDVRGRIRTGSGTSAGDSEIIWSNYASATNAWNVSVRQDIGGANNDLKFLRFDSAGNYQDIVMQITSAAGNVGIGTTSPSRKLHVSAGADDNSILATSIAGNAFIGFADSGTTSQTGLSVRMGSVGNGMVFQTGGTTERMRISSTGIVTMSAYGAGAATFSAAGVISSVSDETWKIKDGVPVNPDEMLQKLKPGYWFYNEEKAPIFGTDRQLGFYAQNVNEAIGPEAAPPPEEGKPWGYYDRSVLAVTVMSLQKALTIIESLTERLAALENK